MSPSPHHRPATHRPSFTRRALGPFALLAVVVGAAACGGGDDSSSPATTASAALGPVQTVQQYFERFADQDMDGAASLTSEQLVAECGGHDAMVDALRDAWATQDNPLRISGGRFQDGPSPRVLATPRVPTGSEDAGIELPIGVVREDGSWRIAEYHPGALSRFCSS